MNEPREKTIHFLSRLFFLPLSFLLFVSPSSSLAKTSLDPAQQYYLNDLMERAEALQLSQDRYWRILLHYRRALWGGVKSEVRQREFFTSDSGNRDPRAELRSTLKSFFEPLILKENEDPKNLIEHPQCRWIDRYQWLKKKLRFDSKILPEQRCFGFEEWKKRLDPQSVTLVFASYYLHNPSSVFGHTLLRFNRTSGQSSPLLDWGVNYAATQTNQSLVWYSFLGLVGGLPGVFSHLPYYLKVEEYSNLESRDLWEYELNLRTPEIEKILYHLWAVGHVAFPYYFADKNCSYMLLTLLEAGDPKLQLSNQLSGWAIPADTVRIVSQTPGLVRQVHYRPALATRMVAARKKMSKRQDELFLRLAQGEKLDETLKEIQSLSLSESALVLDTALEYLQYKKIEWKKDQGGEQKVESGDPQDLALRKKLLVLRSKNPDSGMKDFLNAQNQEHLRPDLGHGSFRLSFGAGYDHQADGFSELAIRFAFHDLNSHALGYPRNAKMEVLHFKTRFYLTEARLKLESFHLVDVASITPIDRLFKKMSWSFKMGVESLRDTNCDECNLFRTQLGMGYALEAVDDQMIFYGLGKFDFGASSGLRRSFRVGPGVEIGALMDWGLQWSLLPTLSYYFPILGQTDSFFEAGMEGRYSPSVNQDFRIRYLQFDEETFEVGGNWSLYF